jgi:uncharacterized protein
VSARPLRIGVAELRRRPGNRIVVQRSVPLEGLEITTARVPDGAEVELELTMEALSDGVTVAGVVHVPWEGECRRCLEMTSGVVTAEIAEVYKDRAEAEILPIVSDSIDLGQVVHDAAILALPLAPLCRDDCVGPDPEEFPVVTADAEDAAPQDPRWAALAELRFDSDPPDSLG